MRVETEEDVRKREALRTDALAKISARELEEAEKERKTNVTTQAAGVRTQIANGAVGISEAELSTLLTAASLE